MTGIDGHDKAVLRVLKKYQRAYWPGTKRIAQEVNATTKEVNHCLKKMVRLGLLYIDDSFAGINGAVNGRGYFLAEPAKQIQL